MRWILVLALVFQCFQWWRVDGYQLADSVEFMERARIFVRGEQMVDAGAIRPFGFSFVLAPFFALADWIGLHDLRPVVWCVVLLQMALACVLVWRCMRLGARVCGRRGAIVAGFLVATNPVLVQYSTQPVSDIAAAVCIAFALEHLLDRAPFRRALRAGAWLGLAFMVAYKALLIGLVLCSFVLLRDRFQHRRTWQGASLGLAGGLLAQSVLDWVLYSNFGASLTNYVVQNAGSVVTSVFLKLYWLGSLVTRPWGIFALPWQWSLDRAHQSYALQSELAGLDWAGRSDISVRGLQSSWYYLVELPTILVWPAIAVAVVAVSRALWRPAWRTSLLLGAVVLAVFVMSNKGSKDFRLWLPLLPFVAPFLASGAVCVLDGIARRARALDHALRVAWLGAVLGFSLAALTSINVRHFGGYWHAMEWVNERARDTYAERAALDPAPGALAEPGRLRVAAAYHWAVFERQSPRIEIVKLPWQLNSWKQYHRRADGGVVQRTQDFATLEDLDVFVVHLPIVAQFPDLMTWVDQHFEVAAAFFDQATYEELGPILVLERRTGSPAARVFSRVERGVDPVRFQESHGLPVATDFLDPATGERVQLLGVEYAALPPQGHGWITYHWRAITELARDYKLLDRITAPDERNVWENNHWPAYGTLPTSGWTPGDVISESYLVVAAHEPFKPQGRFRPIGGAYRRGDLLPVRAWMRVQAYDPATLGADRPEVVAELRATRPGDSEPIRSAGATGVGETPDGIQFSADDAVRVHAWFLPVQPVARLPDDGRPVPD